MSTPTPLRLTFVTGSRNKVSETQAILEADESTAGKIVIENRALDVVEIQGSIDDVVKDKCRRAADLIQGPVLVEDTCLCFDAMGDLPGPFMQVPMGDPARSYRKVESHAGLTRRRKWFLESLGPQNLHKMLEGFEDKSARAIATFAYSEGPGSEPILFQGVTKGKLVPARGPARFGWDPAFEYEGKTYSEMSISEKNAVSHRRKALDKLKDHFKTHHQ